MGLDTALFGAINHASANGLFDAVLPVLTLGKVNTAVLCLVGGAVLLTDRRRGWRVVLVALVAVGLANALGSDLLKHLFARPRPFLTLPDVRLLVGAGHSFSFPSGHAVNTVGAAAVVALGRQSWRWPLLAYAALICYSRVYVGVHYPSDVVGGAVIGLLFGYGAWWFAEKRQWVQAQ